MEKIKRFFECLIPITQCNIKCEYCYVIQEDRRKMQPAQLQYDTLTIKKALTKERLGGVCYFSLCGAGETLLQNEIASIIKVLLENGHYVNVTTNGTIKKRFQEISNSCTKEELKRLVFSFSFHYLELRKRKLLDIFFQNVQFVREMGCSFVLQLNLYDGYLPYLDEIKKICIEKTGALPQLALTRTEPDAGISAKTDIYSELSMDEYKNRGKEFNSPLFDFTCKNFMVKRKEFCYAGDWSGTLNLATGILKPCYFSKKEQNIFEDINKPINFGAVGNNCGSSYCSNSSHFIALGVIPEIKCPSYVQLRNRENQHWYNEKCINFLNQKLYDNNKQYSSIKKIITNIKWKTIIRFECIVQRIIRKITHLYKGD